ncbi:hypothetical protein MPTK1_7g18880 [Marchantia polymorpha subsp. ruderalis]|nr:hypothetical protein MARPO_0067s0089 [Marchantia polymorpha]PTQ36017.1 hypothetical protein MARPO_0067s0089 [Marchantia polymorpha]BBN18018.1 hypothetical protein Mp_7g18880 [Marchantia polymorpha subsp. ruderalis]BBN18019.1 hypothetical protein Mp_7g18880 [Marchantia polymorpha subsp. ruderalis]|eukprot:PTQ36016.1 hypothetical protein MARPO_0067s0089 [Marchantia polymorpha]
MAPGTIRLSVVSGVMSGLEGVYDTKKRITVGRVRVNKFQLKADTVSSKHAVIAHADGRWFITDCDSSNGTSVNGISVIPGTPVELKDGDTLIVGVGSDNIVKVKIETQGAVDVHVQNDSIVKKSALSTLTVKQWIEEEMERLSAETEALAEAVLRGLAESAEQVKKDACSNAGVD